MGFALTAPNLLSPRCFAVEVARSRCCGIGCASDFVSGSPVDMAAAHASGKLTLADAAMLVGAGRLMAAPAGGAMAGGGCQ